ncbi:MAG TPA: hypothetical protein VFQ80_10455, partial [Thermomicrobiales bacterium]|nr:hypothetical protein [Thermomicrobiales bacterium]
MQASPEPRRFERRIASIAVAPEAPNGAPGSVRRGKLRRPTLPADAVDRPRLAELIDAGRAPCTLIVAPGGFGKTIAAAEWAAAANAAWLTADAGDVALDRFWVRLRAALNPLAPGVGEPVTIALAAPLRPAAIDLGRMLADELADVAGPVRLVIDDLHLIPPSEVHEFIAGLLEPAPPTLRLLVVARNEPPLPLNRLRLHGSLHDVRGADLLFTEEEIRRLLERAVAGATDSLATL